MAISVTCTLHLSALHYLIGRIYDFLEMHLKELQFMLASFHLLRIDGNTGSDTSHRYASEALTVSAPTELKGKSSH
jgi:hypothetical protein